MDEVGGNPGHLDCAGRTALFLRVVELSSIGQPVVVKRKRGHVLAVQNLTVIRPFVDGEAVFQAAGIVHEPFAQPGVPGVVQPRASDVRQRC